MRELTSIDSNSSGDPNCFCSLADLQLMLDALRTEKEQGAAAMIVRKGEGGRREILEHVSLGVETGVPGDAWGRNPQRDIEAQLAVMQLDVAELIAAGQPLALFGDNLFLTLDLSAENLPPGSRLRVGEALLEVTPLPHDGCRKFRARFGDEALKFVSNPRQRHRNLRGIYLRVVQEGEVRQGDAARVESRA
ncbi:MAG: hypothetical protein RIC55_25465 [Pirellulaceae bacterium]